MNAQPHQTHHYIQWSKRRGFRNLITGTIVRGGLVHWCSTDALALPICGARARTFRGGSVTRAANPDTLGAAPVSCRRCIDLTEEHRAKIGPA